MSQDVAHRELADAAVVVPPDVVIGKDLVPAGGGDTETGRQARFAESCEKKRHLGVVKAAGTLACGTHAAARATNAALASSSLSFATLSGCTSRAFVRYAENRKEREAPRNETFDDCPGELHLPSSAQAASRRGAVKTARAFLDVFQLRVRLHAEDCVAVRISLDLSARRQSTCGA